ncbi:hypothetical protein G3N96_05045 [Burkholderia sp. Se-20373]|uniref:hypothetical protein n=1 Tax=Burkholderia sp. Se-20373 TaxID=2703898 RepID=UPI00197F39F3|nr:hypothetical protein [Burkholderia sp. Se-20373]MBN3744802.1 hypothetical protein [Burkholderia sp. Se-20373]
MTNRPYRPKNPMLRATYEQMLKVGDTRRPNQGGLSNAFCTARDTGMMPAWCPPGTPSFAAAKAGLQRRTDILKGMTYRGFVARIDFDERDRIFVGRVLAADSVISFHSKTVDELTREFHTAIDHYLTERDT